MNISKRSLILILALTLIIISGVVAFTVWRIQESYKAVGESSQDTNKTGRQYSTEQRQELIDEVNKLYGLGDYKGAVRLIESQNNVNDSEMQLLLAGAYANSDDYNKALEIYKRLDAADKLPDVSLENMASIAEGAKDYQLAIDLYKRAKAYEISSNSGNTDQIAVYDYKIAELEKKL
jgi:tetratricopeptide (TPR) repeat protein